MKLWELLSESSKQTWPKIYKKFKGKEWIPPKKDKPIHYPKAKEK